MYVTVMDVNKRVGGNNKTRPTTRNTQNAPINTNNMNRRKHKPGTKFNPFEMLSTSNSKASKNEIKNKQNTIHFGAGMKLSMRYFPKYMQLVDKKKHMYAIYFQIIPYFNGIKMDHRPDKMLVS